MSGKVQFKNTNWPETAEISLTRVSGSFKMSKACMEAHGYTFERILGEGAFGKVVKAHSVRLGRLVAIKITETNKKKHRFMSRNFCLKKRRSLGP